MRIHKGDKIRVIAGKDRGKEGTVEKLLAKKGKVVVSGASLYKKHVKPSSKRGKGGIIEIPMPLDISNVKLVCPSCGETVRVGYKFEGDKKLRVCKKCGVSIDTE